MAIGRALRISVSLFMVSYSCSSSLAELAILSFGRHSLVIVTAVTGHVLATGNAVEHHSHGPAAGCHQAVAGGLTWSTRLTFRIVQTIDASAAVAKTKDSLAARIGGVSMTT